MMWDERYRMLREDEVIQEGDECDACNDGWRDEVKWESAGITVGRKAPDPAYPSHRKYRRLRLLDSLKPCPFCGDKAKMTYWRKQDSEFMQWGRILCTNYDNGCTAAYGKEWSDIRCETRHETTGEERAIAAWNTRAGSTT